MTRRAFLAAAFGTVSARALPELRPVNYYISAPISNAVDSSGAFTPDMLTRALAIISEHRDDPTRW